MESTNVIDFESKKNLQNDDQLVEKEVDETVTEEQQGVTLEDDGAVEESTEEEPVMAIEDPDNPLSQMSMANVQRMLKQVEEFVGTMESIWEGSKKEFQLTDSHMKLLYKYNEENCTPMPENLTEEEKQNWDRFNGLDNITEEEVVEIFGEGHPIIGVMHTQTIDRLKTVINDFLSWLSALKEYRNIHDAYLKLIELEEEKNMQILKVRANEEPDPEKKAKLEEAIDLYYNRKYLRFLAEPLDEATINRLVYAFNSEKKIEYWMNRTRDKLRRMKLSSKAILEISQFEKRFLPEKYHNINNMLLLYFMSIVTYCQPEDKKDDKRNKAVCMVIALDSVIRNQVSEEIRKEIIDNIIAFEDQLVDKFDENGIKKS